MCVGPYVEYTVYDSDNPADLGVPGDTNDVVFALQPGDEQLAEVYGPHVYDVSAPVTIPEAILGLWQQPC